MRIRRFRRAVAGANYDWTCVQLVTDTGLAGLGECFFAPGLGVRLNEAAARAYAKPGERFFD
jgi:hypothetical protein